MLTYLLEGVCVVWILMGALGFLYRRLTEVLEPKPWPEGKETPLVSAIVPARNEAHVIRRVVGSLLAQQYPNLEVIVVDDESTDGTGAILAEVAATDTRLKVVKGSPLAPGWIGKCWALEQGYQHCGGEWILFTDADTCHEPLGISASLQAAQAKNLDMLTGSPWLECESFWERVILPLIFSSLILVFPPPLINNPKSKMALANGQYLLWNRKSYERFGRHEPVKDKVAEDLMMARRVKELGYRMQIFKADSVFRTRMYRNFNEIWSGWIKNAFLGLDKNFFLLALALLWNFYTWLSAPCVALGSLWCPVLEPYGALALGAFAVQTLVIAGFNTNWHVKPYYALLAPLGGVVFMAIQVTSAYRLTWGKGSSWKGRTYKV